MKNEQQSQNLLLKVDPPALYFSQQLSSTRNKCFCCATSWSHKVKNGKHRRKLATKQCCATVWRFLYLVFRRLKLSSREGRKTNKKLLKSCQESKYQYASFNYILTQQLPTALESKFVYPLPGVQFTFGAQRKTWRTKSAVREGERTRIKPLSPLFRSAVFSRRDPTNRTRGRGYDPSQAHFFYHRLNA